MSLPSVWPCQITPWLLHVSSASVSDCLVSVVRASWVALFLLY